MRIVDLTTEDRPGHRRIRARLVWEGAYRGPSELWYETDAAFAADFEATPETFLLAATPVAARFGERRLEVEGAVCPRLVHGLEQAMALLAHWYPTCRVVPLEPTSGTRAIEPRAAPRAAAFLSGGVDSLSMLARNRATLPLAHPGAIRDGLFLFGCNTFDFDAGGHPRPERLRATEEQRARMQRLADATGWTLLPVRSNWRTLYPDYPSSRDVGFAAGMLGAAHAFRRRFTEVWFASAHGVGVEPHGSHPILDPLYSSSALQVRCGDPARSRLAKVGDVVRWDVALDALQSCVLIDDPPPGQVNCGRCEKCVRTMLAILAHGRLAACPTFARADLTASELAPIRVTSPQFRIFVSELVAPLRAQGRDDLAAVLEQRLAKHTRRLRRRNRWWRRLGRAWLGAKDAAQDRVR
jgi:hypothetical protein